MRGVILAGGQASRFGGRPKGLEHVGGVRIVDRLAAAFTEAFGTPPLVITNDPHAEAWLPAGCEARADVEPGLGALGGLRSAVELAPAPTVVAAWDMPFVTAAALRLLADGLADADACVPLSGAPRGAEPLLAAYGPACAPAIRAALARGDRRATAFLSNLRVTRVPAERFPDAARLFINVNTPDDLAAAEALA